MTLPSEPRGTMEHVEVVGQDGVFKQSHVGKPANPDVTPPSSPQAELEFDLVRRDPTKKTIYPLILSFSFLFIDLFKRFFCIRRYRWMNTGL